MNITAVTFMLVIALASAQHPLVTDAPTFNHSENITIYGKLNLTAILHSVRDFAGSMASTAAAMDYGHGPRATLRRHPLETQMRHERSVT